ncbi:MAG: hypothetical protein B7Y99_04935 [Caulobacterales bacterium 32-69-10]|nr:MAG: hypothetical protein B7Y99_04935 [Caulobacterales bacterium 32-69-10]
MLHDIQAWLETWPTAAPVRDVVSVKALLESLHILSNAVILFSIGMITLRLMGLAGRSQSAAGMTQRFAPWVWSALAVTAITGLVLLTGAGRRGLENPMFAVKVAAMALAVGATAILQLTLSRNAAFWELSPARRAGARVLAPLCFLAWIATVCAGRWLAYSSAFFPPAY